MKRFHSRLIPALLLPIALQLSINAFAADTSPTTQPTSQPTPPPSQVTFFHLVTTGPDANRVVYIIDRSGSMLDNFDYLKQETKRSINSLSMLQFFDIIMLSEDAVPLSPSLQRATDEAKHHTLDQLDQFVAEGSNDDLLPPFLQAFKLAFAMRPRTIFFLTDGHFSPRLPGAIALLNQKAKVHINTVAFINHEPTYEKQLQDLAKQNDGQYNFIPAPDASQPKTP